MSTVTLADIQAAHQELRSAVNRTPLLTSRTMNRMVGAPVLLKAENLQRTGSFKVRGAFHCLNRLARTNPGGLVVTASAGNHAQGIALASSLTGMRALVFMPETASLAKVQATTAYGAEVRLVGNTFDEAVQAAQEYGKAHGGVYVSAFDHDDIITGQGTIALEMLEDRPDLDTVIVPVGGGGLISGMAIALKESNPNLRVIGVQAEAAASMVEAWRRHELVALPMGRTIADGIAIKYPSERTLRYLERYVDEMVTVSDEAIAETIVLALERLKLVLEGAGAAALAALLHGKVRPGALTGVVLSGGNIDPKLLSTLISRQMLKSDRYARLLTVVEDTPGGLVRVLEAIAELRGNLIEVTHHRVSAEVPLGMTGIELELETRDRPHLDAIVTRLHELGCRVTIMA
ncbi:MAG TPA: threonine ammonia-lyase [Stenomitos sp.]